MEIIPFDKRIGFIWYNGKFVEWQNATTHVLNHGLHYGSCVFEGLRVYGEKIYKLEKHTDRLFFSAQRMGIEVPYSKDEINNAQEETIKKNEYQIWLCSTCNMERKRNDGNICSKK